MAAVRKFLMAGMVAAAFYAIPGNAADEVNLNSGFGKDMFAGEEHPAFVDPSIHDPAKLDEIAPAAGVEEKSVDGKENDPVVPGAEKKMPPGMGGMSSTIITK